MIVGGPGWRNSKVECFLCLNTVLGQHGVAVSQYICVRVTWMSCESPVSREGYFFLMKYKTSFFFFFFLLMRIKLKYAVVKDWIFTLNHRDIQYLLNTVEGMCGKRLLTVSMAVLLIQQIEWRYIYGCCMLFRSLSSRINVWERT